MLKNIHNKKLKKTQRLFKQFIIEVPFGILKKGSKGILYEIQKAKLKSEQALFTKNAVGLLLNKMPRK